jgi:hypothetical protein
MQVDTEKLNKFMERVLNDVGAMANASLIRLGGTRSKRWSSPTRTVRCSLARSAIS